MNSANIKKTIRYCKKNGLLQAIHAVSEKLSDKIRDRDKEPYQYDEITQEEYEKQQMKQWINHYKISIVVPAFETKRNYLVAMIESVLNQSYTNFELIIVDASTSLEVKNTVKGFNDERIKYYKLNENRGISENTNQGLYYATGEYIGLLDHDDTLTKDALYEIVQVIEDKNKEGIQATLVYSDEDKMDEDGITYFEPHRKLDFNLDCLLSNNYICHFTVIESKVIKKLKFRKEYDGAQDYDMILRAVLMAKEDRNKILHVNKILYHWRCHSESTAQNPNSKMYAYESGRQAIISFLNAKKWTAQVEHWKHLGFYRINYADDIWKERPNVAGIGGPVVFKGIIHSGAVNERGRIIYKGLRKHYSGYMKRASLQQQSEVLDLRNIKVNPIFQAGFEEVLEANSISIESLKYNRSTKYIRDYHELNIQMTSQEFTKIVNKEGFILVYDPLRLPE